jgi:hypothetical protein
MLPKQNVAGSSPVTRSTLWIQGKRPPSWVAVPVYSAKCGHLVAGRWCVCAVTVQGMTRRVVTKGRWSDAHVSGISEEMTSRPGVIST